LASEGHELEGSARPRGRV